METYFLKECLMWAWPGQFLPLAQSRVKGGHFRGVSFVDDCQRSSLLKRTPSTNC